MLMAGRFFTTIVCFAAVGVSLAASAQEQQGLQPASRSEASVPEMTGHNDRTTPDPTILGTSALDLNSMPGDYGTLPRSVTYNFVENGEGKWSSVIDIVAPDDSVRHITSHFTLNGVAVPIEGDQLEADAVAASLPAADILVLGLSKDGRPGSVRVYTVSSDGKQMTESAVNVNDEGMPFVRTFRFTRVGE